MKNKSLKVPASALTGSRRTDRVEAAIVNNFRAVADPGKSFSRATNWKTSTPAITTRAIPIARTAGFRTVFFHVHLEGEMRSVENHSAVSGGIGITRTRAATARSKFC